MVISFGPCQTMAFIHTTSTVFTNSPSPVIAIRTSSPPCSVNSTAGMTDVPVKSTAPTGKSMRAVEP